MIEWGVGSVVVWCSKRENVIAVLTLTDFIISLLSETGEESTTVEEAISSNQLVWLDGSCKLVKFILKEKVCKMGHFETLT